MAPIFIRNEHMSILRRPLFAAVFTAMLAAVLAAPSLAQQPGPASD